MPLTCLSCKLIFSIPQLHYDHYKTDWHRYNLKRQIAELPPLTKDEYEKRLAAFKESEAEKDKKVSVRCESCNKHFSTQNAMDNHLKSRKHLETKLGEPLKPNKSVNKEPKEKTIMNVAMTSGKSDELQQNSEGDLAGDSDEWEDGDEEDWESCDESDGDEKKTIVIDTNDCLFCDHVSDSTENNVSHMTAQHSFFIPDIEYLVDLDGLIATLAAKIHINHICLWCNGKGRGFKSVKSVKQHMLSKGHCKMLHEGEALFDYTDVYDYSTIPEENEPPDISELDDLLSDADYELVLPSGATLGHRSLARYYKQNLKPLASDSKHKVKKVLQYYQSIGYSANAVQISAKKVRDISYMKRIKDRYNLKLGVKQNKLLQPHFRKQVMF